MGHRGDDRIDQSIDRDRRTDEQTCMCPKTNKTHNPPPHPHTHTNPRKQALKYVSYPTQALGKSCKMVPVMLLGVLIRGKKYRAFEYLCVALVTVGITLFQLYGACVDLIG